ncbi:MAG: MoxR family ATPase [Oscillospiraceae bacterium]|nr:MoxR family ATPase [Oscillospiraceae bacterium]
MNQETEMTAKEAARLVQDILHEVRKVVVGKDIVILKVLLAMLAKGHVLLEDMPGVGKTTLALAFAKTLDLDYHRLQLTPDVLPTDITGFSIYQKESGTFEFKKGVAFCNLLLADEINRTSSKTQAALLEVMEESGVTVDGTTYPMPLPYCVLATQNPVGCVGTQMLPESQLDRFMLRLHMGYPDLDSEIQIMQSRKNTNPLDEVKQIATADDLLELQSIVENVHVEESVYRYIAQLAEATRNHEMLRLGVSPRGSLALIAASKAVAVVRGRDYVVPDDITVVVHEVFCHRLMLSSRARMAGLSADDILDEILESVSVPTLEKA